MQGQQPVQAQPNFGNQQPQYQPREQPQPYGGQPPQQQGRPQYQPNQNYQPQQYQQPQHQQPQYQPQAQPPAADVSDGERLPSFITGAQPQPGPQQAPRQNGYENQGGDRYRRHRRRRHRGAGGPRPDLPNRRRISAATTARTIRDRNG